MKTFRFRLTAIMMTLIFISVLAAGVALGQVFKEVHINALEENMVREIKLLQTHFPFMKTQGDSETVTKYYTENAKELEELTDSRTTFILRDGTVIGDSEHSASKMDNHLNREEITSITEGTTSYGHSIRTSETLGDKMLYIALPVTSSDGNFDGYIRLSMSLKAVDEGLGRGWFLMFITLIILFVLVAFVCYRVGKSLTSPIEHITKVANQISKLDYDARVKFNRDDEIGQLGKAINGMADSLQTQLKMIRDSEDLVQSVMSNMTGGIIMIDATQNIAVLNKESERMLGIEQHRVMGRPYHELKKRHYELTKLIESSIDHRDRIHEEVRLYTPEELIVGLDGVPMLENDGSYRGMLFLLQDITAIRRLENIRSEFVANVSHELKTPVAAVKGFAETLLSGAVKDEETVRSFLQIIYDEGDRLNRLIGDILELSKIESKRSNLDCSPVHLHSFFDMVIGTLSNEAEKKQIRLLVDVPNELFMEADEDKLKQIFLNLISNGINYTLEGGQVKIQASIDKNEGEENIVFQISDTGIGIPKADLPRVFERFYRVDKGRSRNSGGTGLGLSIVKHLVELHHGTLMVESELGTGTTFTVVLPLLQEHADEE
ncbi:two-component system histidine kinase PnpS [Paenibacillus sp. An7]|uniref:two-component system histidine kinase PnpS n=1 Tax=Paenibacillus sp. An7 TaxID=2689577 RepID=UPI001357932E|nr:ATP-binding protein [Paenibacillus sp. An7]